MWGKFFLYAHKPKRANYVQQLMRISDEITMKNAGIRQGLRRGRIEGKKEQVEEDAIALLKDGDSPEKISRCLRLPLEKVLELKKTLE